MRRTLAIAVLTAMLPGQSARDLTGYLPPDTPLVLDLHDAAVCVRGALDLLQPLPKGLPQAGRLFLMGLPVITKAATGMDLTDLLEVVAPSQAAFAMYPNPNGTPFPVLLTRVSEVEEVRRLHRRIGKSSKIHASIDDGVLTVTDGAAHLRTVLQFRRSGKPSLLAREDYLRQRVALESGKSIRFYVNVEVLRGKYAKRKSYWDQLDGGSRFFVGPIVRTFDLARRVDGRLDITQEGLRLQGQVDGDLDRDPKRVGRLVASGSKGRKIPVPPADTLAFISLDRDLGEFLAHPDEWLGDDGATGVKSFLSVADQFLGGSSLVKDLIPTMEMPLSLFITDSTPEDDADVPRLKLPAFTLVFGVSEGDDGENEDKAKKMLTRAMNVITSIANVQRVQGKQAPLVVRSGRSGDYRFKSVKFGDWNGPGDPPTEQGLSPTLLFAHGYGIVASTIDGAVRMAKSLELGETREVIGDFVTLHGDSIAEFVLKNRSILTIDRVLKEGESRREAAVIIDALAAAVRMLSFDGAVEPRTGATRFTFRLRRSR